MNSREEARQGHRVYDLGTEHPVLVLETTPGDPPPQVLRVQRGEQVSRYRLVQQEALAFLWIEPWDAAEWPADLGRRRMAQWNCTLSTSSPGTS